MRQSLILFTVFFIAISCLSCKKVTNAPDNCSTESVTIRTITNKQATIKLTDDACYIIEDGTIDTRLKPCTLQQDFQVNDLRVTISGMVKSAVNTGVCCTENFVLTKIER
jgi:hypothetical protein